MITPNETNLTYKFENGVTLGFSNPYTDDEIDDNIIHLTWGTHGKKFNNSRISIIIRCSCNYRISIILKLK